VTYLPALHQKCSDVSAKDAPLNPRPNSPEARTRRRRILIVAGEASGDLHGADLAEQILARDPSVELFGIAGEHMKAAGVRPLVNLEEIAGMGGMELLSTLRRTVGALRAMRRLVRKDPPDLAILIDYAEFNMMLARSARRARVPVLYYITPQVWAWRRGRIRKLAARTDQMAVVFPFEADLFASKGGRATFVGHPLLDRVNPSQGRAETLTRHGLESNAKLLAILPGSRRGEIRYLMRPMAEAARILAKKHGLTPIVALAPTLSTADLRVAAGPSGLDGLRIIEGDTYSIIAASEVALVASGTATLETALLGCPMVIAYKMSASSYALGRLLVTGVEFIGMPNILAQRRVVPELIQWEVTPANLVRAAEAMLAEPTRDQTAAALKSIRQSLGVSGAAGRVAEMALGMVG
jgi:lipid-A-disaccharide synthase